jgi:hypothetical protein
MSGAVEMTLEKLSIMRRAWPVDMVPQHLFVHLNSISCQKKMIFLPIVAHM